jgi:hypothetical protein
MQQLLSPVPYPDAGEFKMLEALVSDTVSAAITAGQATGQFHGWHVQAWTSETRLVHRAHLRILFGDALWQQADWILDWPMAGRTVH